MAGFRPKVRKVRRRKARKVVRRRKVPRGIGSAMSQYATIIESFDQAGELTANFNLNLNAFSLGQFPRALQVAQFYKWYKAEYVEYEYTPYFNTFDGTAASGAVPYFFSIMNRTQDVTGPVSGAITEDWLLSVGAKPRAFSKKIVIRYKPNWCAPGLIMTRLEGTPAAVNGVATGGIEAKYGWLAAPNNTGVAGLPATTMQPYTANASTFPAGFTMGQNFPQAVVYNGHAHYLLTGPTNTPPIKVGNLIVRVKWCFKHPSSYAIPPPPTGIEEVPQ